MILFTMMSPAALHAAQPAKDTKTPKDYEAQIRWTRYGIPHITANDFGSLAFGEGYAFAKDHLGSLLDQVIKVRGERARHFVAGPGNRHLNSDITFRALGFVEQAKELFPKLSQENRETLEGYAAAINAYRRENREKSVASFAHWGLGSDWLFDVMPLDILAYNQSVIATTPNLGDLVATATPPKADSSEPVAQGLPIPEFQQAHARYNAVPWVNTIAASADGRTWFADTSATPNLSPAATAAFTQRLNSDFLAKVAWQRGVALFDGSKSANEWQNDPSTRPGVLPYSKVASCPFHRKRNQDRYDTHELKSAW